MWLIDTQSLELHEFNGGDVPPYAILSHTWQGRETTYQDFAALASVDQSRRSLVARDAAYAKIHHTCRLARQQGIGFAWIDTCCINKTSSAELTEAINSMFQWYASSQVCFAFLSDLKPLEIGGSDGDGPGLEGHPTQEREWEGEREQGPDPDASQPADTAPTPALDFEWCRWFSRGWTLQELIASRRIEFYDSEWNYRGTKEHHAGVLQRITGVDERVLLDASCLHSIPVARRMSWAAGRQSTRLEDTAYSLLGIFGVHMPLLYGEGRSAFLRLQEEILKTSVDLTLFAWRAKDRSQRYRGCFASSPDEFFQSGDVVTPPHESLMGEEFAMTNKGLRIKTRLYGASNGRYVMSLRCRKASAPLAQQMCLCLRMHGSRLYARDMIDSFSLVDEDTLVDRTSIEGTIYVLRTVDAALSAQLTASHRHAVVLRGGVLEHRRLLDLVSPPELYDAHRGLVLTGGAWPFFGSLRVRLGHNGPLADVVFAVEAGPGDNENTTPRAWVSIAPSSAPKRLATAVLAARRAADHDHRYPAASLSVGVLKATVTIKDGLLEGQSAYFLDLVIQG